jgi:hypothetical protein
MLPRFGMKLRLPSELLAKTRVAPAGYHANHGRRRLTRRPVSTVTALHLQPPLALAYILTAARDAYQCPPGRLESAGASTD